MNTFVHRLRETIKKIGTISEFSEISGISVRSLSNYLNKGTDPGLKTLVKIKEIAGVSIDWLATGEDDDTSEAGVKAHLIDKEVLCGVVEELENYLNDRKLFMEPVQKGIAVNALYHLVYRHCEENGDTLDDLNMDELLKSMNQK